MEFDIYTRLLVVRAMPIEKAQVTIDRHTMPSLHCAFFKSAGGGEEVGVVSWAAVSRSC